MEEIKSTTGYICNVTNLHITSESLLVMLDIFTYSTYIVSVAMPSTDNHFGKSGSIVMFAD